jgi:hypothetical protein
VHSISCTTCWRNMRWLASGMDMFMLIGSIQCAYSFAHQVWIQTCRFTITYLLEAASPWRRISSDNARTHAPAMDELMWAHNTVSDTMTVIVQHGGLARLRGLRDSICSHPLLQHRAGTALVLG